MTDTVLKQAEESLSEQLETTTAPEMSAETETLKG